MKKSSKKRQHKMSTEGTPEDNSVGSKISHVLIYYYLSFI
jgi:hypothetical protein